MMRSCNHLVGMRPHWLPRTKSEVIVALVADALVVVEQHGQ